MGAPAGFQLLKSPVTRTECAFGAVRVNSTLQSLGATGGGGVFGRVGAENGFGFGVVEVVGGGDGCWAGAFLRNNKVAASAAMIIRRTTTRATGAVDFFSVEA